jgi:hypothetical protein
LKPESEPPKPEAERKKKKREKKDKDAATGLSSTETGTDEKTKRNAICPWEDEWVQIILYLLVYNILNINNPSISRDLSNAVEAPFVKTYATLGYL